MSEPAFQRLPVDERRAQLLALGEQLFTEVPYADLSMARIAREAGISKALLYHYFPSKQDFFQATLTAAAEELARRTTPQPDLPPAQQLLASVDAYLGWVQEHEQAYRRILETAVTLDEVRALVGQVRGATAQRILDGLGLTTPRARAAVNGWLHFMDGVCLDWLDHRDMSREEVVQLMLQALGGVLADQAPGL